MPRFSIYIIVALIFAVSDCSYKAESDFQGFCYEETSGKVGYIKTEKNGEVKTIILEDANPNKFIVLGENKSEDNCVNCDVWAKDSMNVYYKYQKLLGADPLTFEVLGNGYSKDKNKVFFKGNLILNSNADRFITIGEFYAKDDKNLWFCGIKITGEYNVESITIFDGYFSKDAENVYLNNDTNLIKINGADPEIFKEADNTINSNLNTYRYYTDNKKMYFLDTELNPVDINYFYSIPAIVNSFQVLDEKHFSKDSINIYYRGEIIKNTISDSHLLLGNNYSKNDVSVYYKSRILAGADNVSFELSSNDKYDAKDSLNYYFEGEKIDINNCK